MLTLSILRCPDAVPPQTKQISGGEFRIGRAPDNDWVMPDPERLLSKKHCVVAFRNGGWAIADTSTNGTYLNREAEPIGAGRVRNLADGDRIRLGAYEVEVRITADAPAQGYAPPRQSARPAFDDPFGDDPLAAPAPPSSSFTTQAFGASDPLFGGATPTQAPISLPDDFDPLAPTQGGDFFGAPARAPGFGAPPTPPRDYFSPSQPPPEDFRSPASQPDHTPAFSDAFTPPKAIPQIPAEDDDWDLGFSPAPVAPPPPAAAPAYEPPPAPAPVSANPFAEAPPAAPPAYVPPPAPAPALAPAYAAPAPTPAPGGDALLAAFLEGAGLTGAKPENPAALMQALGAAFRATVSGIRQALIARASIKGEFRIEQTMIRARGNNPLKFSADDDDALAALMGNGRRVDMKPDAAIADALRDMRLHELASMAAMQEAVRALLTQLSPAPLRAEAEQGGGLTLLPAQKKARAFEAYEKLHETITRDLADDFDRVFGKAFAKAYEAAMRDVSARDN